LPESSAVRALAGARWYAARRVAKRGAVPGGHMMCLTRLAAIALLVGARKKHLARMPA